MAIAIADSRVLFALSTKTHHTSHITHQTISEQRTNKRAITDRTSRNIKYVEDNNMSSSDQAKPKDKKVYVIVTKPQNSLSISTIRQLQSAKIYLAYPSSEEEAAEDAVKRLKAEKIEDIILCVFDPFGSKEKVKTSAKNCIEKIIQQGKIIDGVLFNPYGCVGDGIPQSESGLLELAEYKLIGNAIFLQALFSEGLLKEGSRVIFAGTESARGLPKMGFPVPDLGTTPESVEAFLTGAAYLIQNDPSDATNEAADDQKTTTFKWEHAYADLSATGVLFMSSMAKRHPNIYFGTVSAGMTQESLDPKHVPNPTLGFTIQMFIFRYIMFPLLKRWEIAQDVDDGAAYFQRALTGENWEYASGTFVGAKGGTGGPICDQATLSGGEMFLNESMQEIAYTVVQKYLP
jgi:hypothetical protein